MDTTKPVTHVSLCAGYGGIDLGLKRAIPNLRTIAFSEIEAFACANLVAKMEAGRLDAAPIWTDVKTFPWQEFRGKVDILSGGYPCQPFSAAGKRLGKDDPRHLWPWIADGIRICRPAVCFFENVEGHISLGLREVIEELESLGYRTTWGLFSAAEVGAPHQRKRIFILAHRLCERGQLSNQWRFAAEQMPVSNGATGRNELALAIQQGPQGSTSKPLHTGGLQSEIGRGCDVAWPSHPGQPQHEWEPPRVVGNQPAVLGDAASERARGLPFGKIEGQPRFESASGNCSVVGDAAQWQDNGRESQDMGQTEGSGAGGNDAADDAGEARAMADSSVIDGSRGGAWLGWRNGGKINAAAGDEEQQRQTKPALGGNADGASRGMDDAELYVTSDNRTDELRLLGNGVVPATAERAFRTLINRFP
jgi:DNA (cytosine-5)-methyltransferase 1